MKPHEIDLQHPKVMRMPHKGKADTYIPYAREAFFGRDMRTRCAQCGKVWFADEAGAQRSALNARQRDTPMHAYLGKCGHWHTARTRK